MVARIWKILALQYTPPTDAQFLSAPRVWYHSYGYVSDIDDKWR